MKSPQSKRIDPAEARSSASNPRVPRQAVILAGGLGTRLGEITQRIPKPLVPAAGVPFLAYLLRMLKREGIERVLLLLGYKAETIKDWCGDGSSFGLEIQYSIGSIEDGTGYRVFRAAQMLEPTFLLLYCDNYWPMHLEAMASSFAEKPSAVAQVTIYRNRDGYTRNNMRVGEDGMVEVYDKSETCPNLRGIDIGFVIARREVLDFLSGEVDSSFEVEAYTQLAQSGCLAAFETDHRYYGVGNPRRLAEASRFLSRRPCAILRRDDVLGVSPVAGTRITSPMDWRWLPGAIACLRSIHDAGNDVLILDDSPGTSEGLITESQLKKIHTRIRDDAAKNGIEILDILSCSHGPANPCECRLPDPGLILDAQRRFELDLRCTPLVSARPQDEGPAHTLGLKFLRVDPRVGLSSAREPLLRFLRTSGQGHKPTT